MKSTRTEIHFSNNTHSATLHLGDCIKGVRSFADESVSVIVTSPPYNLGIRYSEYKDSLPREEYLNWIKVWAMEMRRILAKDGSLFLNVGGSCRDPLLQMDVLRVVAEILQIQNLIHWIKAISIDREVVSRKNSFQETISFGHYKPINSKKFLNDCHEFIGHYTHSGDLAVNRFAIGVPYQDKSNINRWKHTNGGMRCRGNTWFIPYKTIMSRHRDRPHPASFPSRLAEMCLQLHGLDRIHSVLDPFMGIGSTALACIALDVEFIGFEIDPSYYEEAKKRIIEAAGTKNDFLFD
jgi:site-specific DNA-methyltransferase (adenine-specific)